MTTEGAKKSKRAKWFSDLPKEKQQAIIKREEEYRKKLLEDYLRNQKKENDR